MKACMCIGHHYTIKDDLALPILLALTLKGGLQAKHTMLIFTFKYSIGNQIQDSACYASILPIEPHTWPA